MDWMEFMEQDCFEVVRANSFKEIQEKGSDKDKAQVKKRLEIEQSTGKKVPLILLRRMANPWNREHTKAYQTPTILKNWKDAMPPNVAAYFFSELDIINIEEAYFYDFTKSFGEDINKMIIATCYAFKDLTGESSCHGVWHQGKRVWDGLSMTEKGKCINAANVLRSMCYSKKVEIPPTEKETEGQKKDREFTMKFCEEVSKKGELISELEPYSNFVGFGSLSLKNYDGLSRGAIEGCVDALSEGAVEDCIDALAEGVDRCFDGFPRALFQV